MLLEIENLAVEVAGKRVLKDVNLSIDEGETHVLLGPNGAGKSTLFLTILGFPQYLPFVPRCYNSIILINCS